ncbi:hypothetical protein [Exiguobacterium sp. s133]|uniref:hypothetical protein n=1 Tax=Exiguobacterium sp. s133 TaxID=2751213 RepID=UPI001BE55FCE|nr:hypothetical protein [Exiguobacterium sp. s133]
MKYKELIVQAYSALRALESASKLSEYEIVLYVGRKEWRELCDHHEAIGNESIKIKDARFFGRPIRMLDRDTYFAAGIELKNELIGSEDEETELPSLKGIKPVVVRRG